jgi:hypothetical protein
MNRKTEKVGDAASKIVYGQYIYRLVILLFIGFSVYQMSF